METRELDKHILYSDGSIRSKKTKKLLTMTPGKNDYYFVCWEHPDGRRGRKSVHRIIAEAFIPNPLGLSGINHKDGNKHNNAVNNLEWCDSKYNTAHSIQEGLQNPIGQDNANSKLSEEQAREIKYNYLDISHSELGRRLDVSPVTIGNIRNGKSWKHI